MEINTMGKGAIPWPAEEHGAVAVSLCAVDSVDGKQAVNGDAGSSASENGIKPK